MKKENIYKAIHTITGERVIGTEEEIRARIEIKQKASFETMTRNNYPVKGPWMITKEKKEASFAPRKEVSKANGLKKEDLKEWDEVRANARRVLIELERRGQERRRRERSRYLFM